MYVISQKNSLSDRLDLIGEIVEEDNHWKPNTYQKSDEMKNSDEADDLKDDKIEKAYDIKDEKDKTVNEEILNEKHEEDKKGKYKTFTDYQRSTDTADLKKTFKDNYYVDKLDGVENFEFNYNADEDTSSNEVDENKTNYNSEFNNDDDETMIVEENEIMNNIRRGISNSKIPNKDNNTNKILNSKKLDHTYET
ncbi:11782_t:CDS:2 [Dentiscutata erythropus]|uniref:11782_t:CDS:1 n=1 Tax=Dentiscutata erythropus TaxID=1348616 RepID=A0A9N8ZSX6_9GLOM|nr:11782_t:CDS:2 [Dentiscutata erythropus]